MLEPAFEVLHPKPRRKKHRRKKPQKKAKSGNEELIDIPEPGEEDTQPVDIPESGEARIVAVSNSAMRALLNKLPDVLKSKILTTDHAEDVILENYVKSQSVPAKTLHIYNSAKKDERELLKRLLADMPIILPIYKSVRKGEAWHHTRLVIELRRFFQKPSTALTQYEALKKDELTSLDSFLGSSGQSGAPKSTADAARKIEEAEEAEKRKDEENTKQEEAE